MRPSEKALENLLKLNINPEHVTVEIINDQPVIKFVIQSKPISEIGKVDGVQVTDILKFTELLYEELNRIVPCVENEKTIENIKKAIACQDLRTIKRIAEGIEGAKSIKLHNLLSLDCYTYYKEFLAINDNAEYVFVMYFEDVGEGNPLIFNSGFVCVTTKDKELMLDFFNKKITFGEFYNSEKASFDVVRVHPLEDMIWNVGDAKKYDWTYMNSTDYWNDEKKDIIVEWFEQF